MQRQTKRSTMGIIWSTFYKLVQSMQPAALLEQLAVSVYVLLVVYQLCFYYLVVVSKNTCASTASNDTLLTYVCRLLHVISRTHTITTSKLPLLCMCRWLHINFISVNNIWLLCQMHVHRQGICSTRGHTQATRRWRTCIIGYMSIMFLLTTYTYSKHL
jgi:hypothetical protein